MKLYEHRNERGAIVEWWTQRNKQGVYFSIRPKAGKFAVIINGEKTHCVCDTFAEAERSLRSIERSGEQ